MHKALTNLELEIVREPGTKLGRKHAYVEKAPKLADRLYASGFAVDDYEAVLLEYGIEAKTIEPDHCFDLDIDQMDEKTVLALLTALVKKEEAVEDGFLAACVRSGLIDEILGRLETLDWINRDIPRWIEQAADRALTDLESFPKNAETTPYRAIAPYLGYTDKEGKMKVRGLSNKDEFDIVDALHREAKNHGLYLDSSAYENMVIGLPINIPFRVCKVEVGSEGPQTILNFSIDGWPLNSASFALLRYADCTEAEYHPMDLNARKQVFEPTKSQLEALQKCIDTTSVRIWDEHYLAPVLDGWSWSLTIETEELFVSSSGSNAYPTGFKNFALGLADIFQLADLRAMIDSMGL